MKPRTRPLAALTAASLATVRKPVRGPMVELLDAESNTIATATTDDKGAYTIHAPPNTSAALRIRAQMSRGGAGTGWQVSVRDNTASDAIHAMETPPLRIGTEPIVRDLHAPSGWDGSRYASPRVAAPFAVMDAIHESQAKVLEVMPNAVFEPLRVFWSPHNVPADGNRELGQIGSTLFHDNDTGGAAIYVLGKEGVDTDEYDSAGIVHEWGHYYQATLSRNDAPGGDHSLADSLDPRAAFSEGWANAWSGIALGRRLYTDSSGPRQERGFSFDLSAGARGEPGWYREASIHAVLWALHEKAGLRPIHEAFVGAFGRATALTSIHSFTAAFNQTAPQHAPTLAELLSRQRISGATNAPFGAQEVNDGGLSGELGVLPLYREAALGATQRACVTNRRGIRNKLGNHVFLRFTAPAPRTYTIQVRGPSAADPDIAVYRAGLLASGQGFGSTETLSLPLAAGEYVVVVNDFNHSSAATCFAVTVS